MLSTRPPLEIFNFTAESDLSSWSIVDDVVMGGRSNGSLVINHEGYGEYSGKVSLENNGGFSSLRYQLSKRSVEEYDICQIRLKGDGKDYQFRVKSDRSERHAYIYKFETTGEWQTVEVPLKEMYPTFRGVELDMPNYPVKTLSEIRFLIANKKNENFELELEWIKLL